MKRHALARSKVFKLVGEMFHDKSEDLILSTHFKTKISTGEYRDLLYQMYMMYAEVPHPTYMPSRLTPILPT